MPYISLIVQQPSFQIKSQSTAQRMFIFGEPKVSLFIKKTNCMLSELEMWHKKIQLLVITNTNEKRPRESGLNDQPQPWSFSKLKWKGQKTEKKYRAILRKKIMTTNLQSFTHTSYIWKCSAEVVDGSLTFISAVVQSCCVTLLIKFCILQ